MHDYFMDTYHRLGTLAGGKGSKVWDDKGKEYLDFASGIAVSSLGHGHPALVEAITRQASFLHSSNYFYNLPGKELAKLLCEETGLDKVFLANSGCEANEGAIKLARKWAHDTKGPECSKIITLNKSFHGRTIATLEATGQERFHLHYQPWTGGFAYADPDIDAIEKLIDSKTCALMIEPVQGEGGVNVMPEGFLKAARELCDREGILLILDEVQTGVGRTGTFLACQAEGVLPDILTLAKGLAGGVPIGAILAGGTCATTFGYSDHGTTFGGNPLAASAALAVLSVILEPGFMEGVAAKGKRAMEAIASWKLPCVKDLRGKGLMIGFTSGADAEKVQAACLEKGLILLTAGGNTVRLVPALTISDSELDAGLGILKSVLEGAN
jgi:acetylornithine/N-succinyldiaminopimelate aminotransferase